MTIGALWDIFRSRLWLIVLLPLGAGASAYVLSTDGPEKYAAGATILLNYRTPLEGELAGELLPVGLQSSYLATQVDIIKSRPVAEKAIEMLDRNAGPSWRQRIVDEAGVTDIPPSMMAETLLESLEVTMRPDSRLVEVWFVDTDAEFAAAVANAFVESYRLMNQEMGQSPATATAHSVEAVLEKLRADLEAAESKVSSYQARTGIMATDERVDVETKQLSELMQQKLAADEGLRVAESRLRAAQEEGARPALASNERGSEVLRNLQIAVARKEGEVAERSTSLGERHPEMLKLRAEQGNLRKQLEAETEKALSGIRGAWQQARDLANSTEQAVAVQKKKLVELKHARDGLQPLLRELESARSSYDRATQMYSEYAMHGNLNQTNVVLLSAARVPSTPVERNLIGNVLSAFIGGLLFALGLALFWEFLDQRIRGKGDLSGFGDAGFLGALPKAH